MSAARLTDPIPSSVLRELVDGARRRLELLKEDPDDLDARAMPLSPYEVISLCTEVLEARGES